MDLFGLLLISFMLVPIWMVSIEWRARVDVNYWRRVGIVVQRIEALDGVADVIGRYMGADIYRSIIFKGLRYDFDRVAPPSYKPYLRGRELYLEPGLVYVTA